MRNSQYCEKLENEKKDETKIKFLSECIFIEKFSKNEIKFESELLDMVIQPESVSYATSFTIKECTNYKLTEQKLSPIYWFKRIKQLIKIINPCLLQLGAQHRLRYNKKILTYMIKTRNN
jgi:hypothetical protein